MKKIAVTFLTAAIIFSMALTASAALDAEAIGMGENFSTLNGEADYYSNPAGLALRENNFAVKANVGFSVWNNVFENDEFSKDKIEGKLVGDDLIIAGRGAGGTQFYYKNFALAVNARGEGMISADSDIAEIVTSDHPELSIDSFIDVGKNSITADFKETKGGAATTTDVSLSYAREIFKSWSQNSKKVEGLYFGATYHYLEGDIYTFSGEGNIKAIMIPVLKQ